MTAYREKVLGIERVSQVPTAPPWVKNAPRAYAQCALQQVQKEKSKPPSYSELPRAYAFPITFQTRDEEGNESQVEIPDDPRQWTTEQTRQFKDLEPVRNIISQVKTARKELETEQQRVQEAQHRNKRLQTEVARNHEELERHAATVNVMSSNQPHKVMKVSNITGVTVPMDPDDNPPAYVEKVIEHWQDKAEPEVLLSALRELTKGHKTLNNLLTQAAAAGQTIAQVQEDLRQLYGEDDVSQLAELSQVLKKFRLRSDMPPKMKLKRILEQYGISVETKDLSTKAQLAKKILKTVVAPKELRAEFLKIQDAPLAVWLQVLQDYWTNYVQTTEKETELLSMVVNSRDREKEPTVREWLNTPVTGKLTEELAPNLVQKITESVAKKVQELAKPSTSEWRGQRRTENQERRDDYPKEKPKKFAFDFWKKNEFYNTAAENAEVDPPVKRIPVYCFTCGLWGHVHRDCLYDFVLRKNSETLKKGPKSYWLDERIESNQKALDRIAKDANRWVEMMESEEIETPEDFDNWTQKHHASTAAKRRWAIDQKFPRKEQKKTSNSKKTEEN